MDWKVRTDSNNITIFLVQLMIIDVLPSAKRYEGQVKFGEFAEEGSRIFS